MQRSLFRSICISSLRNSVRDLGYLLHLRFHLPVTCIYRFQLNRVIRNDCSSCSRKLSSRYNVTLTFPDESRSRGERLHAWKRDNFGETKLIFHLGNFQCVSSKPRDRWNVDGKEMHMLSITVRTRIDPVACRIVVKRVLLS